MITMRPHVRTSIVGKLLFPILAVVALLVLVFLGLLPTVRNIDETQGELVQLEADLHQQNALLPIYTALQKRKKQSLPEGVHANQLQRLQIDDLATLPEVFENLAREAEVELVSATPEVRSLENGTELLRVDARLRGDFLSFNTLMNRLNEMPFVESTESLAFDVTNLGHEMSLSVWLAIQ